MAALESTLNAEAEDTGVVKPETALTTTEDAEEDDAAPPVGPRETPPSVPLGTKVAPGRPCTELDADSVCRCRRQGL